MKFTIAIILVASSAFGQTSLEKSVLAEANRLFNVNMASRQGPLALAGKVTNAGRSFSYAYRDKSIFFYTTKGPTPRVLASATFTTSFEPNSASIETLERDFNTVEQNVFDMYMGASYAIHQDTSIRPVAGFLFTFLPIVDSKGKRVYVVTSPQHDNMMFCHDYLFNFGKGNKLSNSVKLHTDESYIAFGSQRITTHMHSDGTIGYITPTDIFILMEFGKAAGVSVHRVVSETHISEWNCETNTLRIRKKEAPLH